MNTVAQEIAKTIQAQVASKTFFMLGAQNLVFGSDEKYAGYLNFKIRGSKKVSHIQIALNGNDLYDMTFYRVRADEIKDKVELNDIYSDQLHSIIREKTGLYTNL